TDDDFEVKLFLRKDGRLLQPDEAQATLNRILPERVSRFFLFDGEFLNDYEVLLAERDRGASVIREDIEDILGVPALLNAVADLNVNLREAGRRQAYLARQHKTARVLGAEADRVQAEIQQLRRDLDDPDGLREQHRAQMQRKRELEEALEATAGLEADV